MEYNVYRVKFGLSWFSNGKAVIAVPPSQDYERDISSLLRKYVESDPKFSKNIREEGKIGLRIWNIEDSGHRSHKQGIIDSFP